MNPATAVVVLLGIPIVLLVIGFAGGVAAIRSKPRGRDQVRRLRDARRGGSFQTFAADFPSDHPAPEILCAVYDVFQRAAANHQRLEELVVRADDDLSAVYDAHFVDDWNDLNDLDLKETIEEAAVRCGRRVVPTKTLARPITFCRVRDVVAYLEQCPRVDDTIAERDRRDLAR
jgi:hypothetical protein